MSEGQYQTRQANLPKDIATAQRLRHRAFYSSRGVPSHGDLDVDAFDARCRHFLVEDASSGKAVATCRALVLSSGAEIHLSYAAQRYDLGRLAAYDRPMIEVGRFCVAPDVADPDVPRALWGGLTKLVDTEKAGLLFGCSSFEGTDAEIYADTFAMLKERHLAPAHWLPRIKSSNVFRFSHRSNRKTDRRRGMRAMPPLLRSYLSMGGWVSDHAVIDRQLNTLHVFTGLEVRAIPAKRAISLRAVAG